MPGSSHQKRINSGVYSFFNSSLSLLLFVHVFVLVSISFFVPFFFPSFLSSSLSFFKVERHWPTLGQKRATKQCLCAPLCSFSFFSFKPSSLLFSLFLDARTGSQRHSNGTKLIWLFFFIFVPCCHSVCPSPVRESADLATSCLEGKRQSIV